METKKTFVVRNTPVSSIEDQPVVLKLKLTDDQKTLIKKITGKEPGEDIQLTAIELNMIVDAAAYAHGSSTGASY